jgi:hypothetical protein
MVGGTEEQRRRADSRLEICLRVNHADDLLTDAVVFAARQFGGLRCRGPRCWRYSSTPASGFHDGRVFLGWNRGYRRR